MLLPADAHSPFQISKLVGIAFITIDQIAKFGWGSDWVDFLNDTGKKIWQLVIDTLREIANFVWDFVKNNFPNLGYYLAVGGLVVGGAFLGFDFIDTKVKAFASKPF